MSWRSWWCWWLAAEQPGTSWAKDAQANSGGPGGVDHQQRDVERGDIRLTASGSGTLVTNQSVNMSFSTSGKVAELNVKLGDMVKTGDVLARLEKAEDLEANLASAQANLLQAQQSPDHAAKRRRCYPGEGVSGPGHRPGSL